jgi:chaperonin cofactor prefoldin
VIEFIPILLAVLLVATVAVSREYYKQILKAKKEYELAKNAVGDIVLSFNRELKRDSERLDIVAFKVEESSAKAESIFKKIDTIEKQSSPLESQFSAISESSNKVLTDLSNLGSTIKNIENTQETLQTKIASLEEQIQKLSVAPPEIKSEPVMPVIPIKRDKAMAALTDTEIAVLEMLASEGPKTAPEIKECVHLSREHTARLMKKLYEGGYLERETGKIPFSYSVKKEMEKLLSKPQLSQN